MIFESRPAYKQSIKNKNIEEITYCQSLREVETSDWNKIVLPIVDNRYTFNFDNQNVFRNLKVTLCS